MEIRKIKWSAFLVLLLALVYSSNQPQEISLK
jgi:hypothetical protein